MGINLKLVNFNKLFNNNGNVPIIINDLSSSTEEDKVKLNHLISTTYKDTDLFSNEPSCECGEIKSGYNQGVMCRNCNTPVSEKFNKNIEPIIWFRAPIGVNKLINPIVWIMLKNTFTKNGFSFINWLTNTDYQSVVKPPELLELQGMGAIRGYNNFVDNFDTYIEYLFNIKYFKNKDNSLKQLLISHKDCVFSDYLPLPNKSILLIEDTKVGVYVDPLIVGAIDAIRTVTSIDNSPNKFTVRQKENRISKTIDALSSFYYKLYQEVLAGKNGLFRKHIFGSRQNFTTRAVISSNTKQHEYDELHLAWGHACTMLKIHITNKLINQHHYTPNDANFFIQYCTTNYHPLMDKIFHELIEESPEKGIPVTYGRNPS